MSVAKTAKLTLALVDQVSGPAKAITGAFKGVTSAIRGVTSVAMAPAKAAAEASRSIARNVSNVAVASGALTLGLAKAGNEIYDFNDTLNQIEGRRFGKSDIFHLADGTKMTREAFRRRVTDLVKLIDRDSPRTAKEIAEAYNELVKAGLTHEQTEAILPISVQFAIAGDYDTREAADKLTNIITSMQMPQATFDDAQKSAQRAADVIAFTANNTNTDVAELAEAFKYAAPGAAALGVNIEQLAAMFAIQAQRGIKASEAGVSIRSMLVRMVRPTKAAAAALAQYNIDLADYLERNKEITSGDVTTVLQAGGLDASGATNEIDKILQQQISTAEKVQKITAAVTKSIGDNTTMSSDTISEAVREVLYSFGESLDVTRLVEDMEKAGIAVSDFYRIFDQRQGNRLMTLFTDDLGRWIESINKGSKGFAKAMSDVRMQGIVGAVQRLDSSLFNLFATIADSGVLDGFTRFFNGLADSVRQLSLVNPQLLEMGTYATIAVAGLAPLGFAMTGLAAAAAILVNPIAWVGAALGYLAYLNFGKITAYLKGFMGALRSAAGPKTVALVTRATEAIKSFFTSTEGPSTWGIGRRHGIAVAKGIESLIGIVQNGVARVRQAFATIVNLPEFRAAANLLYEFAGAAREYFGALGRVLRGLGSGARRFFNAFSEAMSSEAIDHLSSRLSFMRRMLVSTIDAMSNGLGKAAGFWSSIRFDIDAAAASVGRFAGELTSNVINLDYEGMIEKIRTWGQEVWGALNSAYELVRPVFASLGNAWVELGGAVARVAGGIVSGARSFGRAFTDNISPETVDSLSSAFNKLSSAASGFVDWVTSFLPSLETAGGAMSRLANAITGVYDVIAAALSKVDVDVDGVAARVGKATAGMVNDLVSFAARVAPAFGSVHSQLWETGSAMIQSLWDGAVAKFDELIAWLAGIPGRIKAAIGNIDLSGIFTLPELPSPSSWFGGEDKPTAQPPARDEAKISALRVDLNQATADWPLAADRGMELFLNALVSGGGQAESEASRIGQNIETALQVTGHPDVNTGKLERALAIARQLAAAVRGVGSGGGAAASTPANTAKFGGPRKDGGPVKAGLTYLVGEEQPELFTPSRSGRIVPEVPSGGGGNKIDVSVQLTQHINGSTASDLRKLAAEAAEAVVSKVTSVLDSQLNRAPQVAFGGMKPYGDD